ncbi:hypothetical protein E1B28_002938 [Marasmius oreades]|uniref:F-box domain-containing protein n=1 Tax=Marasmius oreades TaxID=181124 RepID=A0A9P7RLI3_9AGAR|nr:uncharacterized protein E1B28_002938 [Marasmius oreades]KAG7085375.1 hypothetical protein E1B28_002938 [Marasmius oreades]
MENPASTIAPTTCLKRNTSLLPPPSFPALELAQLRLNHPPSSSERSHACKILEKEKDQLKWYDKELNRLIGIVNKLKEERSCLERRIMERENWLAGIRHLPIEILAEIFSISCSTYDHALAIYKLEGKGETVVTAPVLALSQVSHHWRRVAALCPRLWSSISVDVGRFTGSYDGIFTAYLENSASHPLKIRIRNLGSSIGIHGSGAKRFALADKILLQSPRIEVLILDIDLRCGLPRDSRYAFPLLREFTTTSRLGLPNQSGLTKSLNDAPLLNTITIAFLNDGALLPYSQLTSLTIGDIGSIEYFYSTLQKCLNLRKLTITHPYNLNQDNHRTIEMPTLHTLSFRTVLDQKLYHNIKFPNLRTFTAIYSEPRGNDEQEWPCPGFRSVIQSCSSTLRSLSLVFTQYTATNLAARQVLELVSPHLSYLEIHLIRDTTGFTEALVSLLTVPNPTENRPAIVVPVLRRLKVTVFCGQPLYTEKVANLIVEMMMSRSQKNLVDHQPGTIEASSLAVALFDFRHPAIRGNRETGGMPDDSDRFLEIINAVQLDRDMSLRALVGLRT